MRYRNRLTFSAAILGIVAQPCVFLYFALFDQTFSGDTLDLIAVASIGSLAIWLFARTGIQPTIRSEGRTLFIRNPLLSYEAPMESVALVARDGAAAIRIEGVGVVHPWVLSRSVFDGKRVRAAKDVLRDQIRAAAGASALEPSGRTARKFLKVGALEVFLLLPVALLIWNVFDIAMGN